VVRNAFPVAATLEGGEMNDARPSKAESSAPGQGAPIIAPGGFPTKLGSVCAEVLARLLNHERLTSLDAVKEASTTRLSAVTHYLATVYGWPIVADDRAAGCRDGRVAWVAEYSLPSDTVARAMAAGASAWCAKVRAARRALRAKAAEAKRAAERANVVRKRRPHPGQSDLFDGVWGAA
jgi:hypothetical protein